MIDEPDNKPEQPDDSQPRPPTVPPQGGVGDIRPHQTHNGPDPANVSPDVPESALQSTTNGSGPADSLSPRKGAITLATWDDMSRMDMLEAQRAIVRGWPMSRETKKALAEAAERIAKGLDEDGHPKDIPERTRLMAIRLLATFDQINLERVKLMDQLGLIEPPQEEVRLIRTPLAGPPEQGRQDPPPAADDPEDTGDGPAATE